MVNIQCSICQDLFKPSDDVHFTPCGHFFHFDCVTTWLKRAPTCPQCREPVNGRSLKIKRAYFDISSDDVKEDSTVLQHKVDSLNLQLSLKNKDVQIAGEECAKLKDQAAGLRAEVKKVESNYEKQRSAIHAYKIQIKHLQTLSVDAEAAKKEVVRLKKNLQEYRTIQTLITDSQDEVDRIVSESPDKRSLATYVSVMKREMIANHERCKELRERLRRLEKDRLSLKAERDSLLHNEIRCRELEADLNHSEREKESLRVKLNELEFQLRSNSKKSSEDIQRFIAESPAPERVRSLRDDTIALSSTTDSDNSPTSEILNRSMENVTIPVTPESEEISPKTSRISKPEETSPYLSVKSRGACGYSTVSKPSIRVKPLTSSLSIMTRKPRLTPSLKTGGESQGKYFDGYGGHSKVDNFPSPVLELKPKVIKNNLMSIKMKRRKLDDGTSKKLDSYFVDLT